MGSQLCPGRGHSKPVQKSRSIEVWFSNQTARVVEGWFFLCVTWWIREDLYMCFSKAGPGLTQSPVPHSWSRDRSDSFPGELSASVSAPLAQCWPALILSDLFALGLGIPKLWPYSEDSHMCSQSCSSAPSWLRMEGAGACLQPAEQRIKQRGGRRNVCRGAALFICSWLPRFQADFFPRIRHLTVLAAASTSLKHISLPFSLWQRQSELLRFGFWLSPK